MSLLNALLYLSVLAQPITFEVIENSKPVAGQKVVLLIQGGEQIGEALSNSQGRVKFDVDPKIHQVVAAGTLYQNAAYISAPVITSAPNIKPVPILVYPSTSDTSDLFIEELSIYFEVTEEGLRVHQGMNLRNSGNSTIIPNSDAGVFSFEVPSSAFDFTYEQGFQREEVANQGNKVMLTGPIYPGQKYFSFSYSVDGARFRAELPQNFSVPVANLSFLSNFKNIRYVEPSLKFAGSKFYAGGMQDLYQRKDWNQSSFNIAIRNLPLRLPWYWVLPWFVVAILLVLGNLPSKTKKDFQPKREFEKLLEDWLYLQRLRRENLVSDQAYRDRKFRLLEDLVVFYNGEGNESKRTRL